MTTKELAIATTVDGTVTPALGDLDHATGAFGLAVERAPIATFAPSTGLPRSNTVSLRVERSTTRRVPSARSLTSRART